MSASTNHQVIIASLPEGRLSASDYEVRSVPMPQPAEGQVLCRTLAFTMGAGQRAGLQGSASYAGAPETGRVMGGTGIARIEASRHADFAVGDLVRADTGWQEWSVHDGNRVGRVDPAIDAADHLGLLGTNGLTAWFGLTDIGRPEAGQTVLVSAAAGSVGHLVGQIAASMGARVVGVAGSDEKAKLLVDELGFDVGLNRLDPDFRAAFKDATPDRVHVYFDNTGGAILESALFRMATRGRIVCCGAVSQYDTSTPGGGPRGVPGLLVNNRVRMEGFIVFDYADRYEEGRAALTQRLIDGRITPRTTQYHGLASAPQAFVDLLGGRTIGTTIVRLDA